MGVDVGHGRADGVSWTFTRLFSISGLKLLSFRRCAASPCCEVPHQERACHVVGAGTRTARGGTAAGGGLGDGPAVGRPRPGPTASEAAAAVDSPTGLIPWWIDQVIKTPRSVLNVL